MPKTLTKKVTAKASKNVKAATKKTAAKKVSKKKVTVRKSSSKKSAAPAFKALVCAIDGECFWTRNGNILKNLEDLYLAFGSMDDQIFLHHVTKQKNDFADWTEYVLNDVACADDLRKTKKKAQAQKVVRKHLSKYSI